MNMAAKPKEKKRTMIIEAAVNAFSQHGYAGTKMVDIADQAGIGKGTIYAYFKSKEELFYEILEWYLNESNVVAVVGLSALSGPVADQLEALNKSILAYIIEMIPLYRLLLEFWAASTSPRMHHRIKETFRREYGNFRHRLASMIKNGMDRGEFQSGIDPEAVAAGIVGAWDALGLQLYFEEGFDIMTAGEQFIAIMIRGMVVAE